MNWNEELACILKDVDVSDLSSSDINEIHCTADTLDLSDVFDEWLRKKQSALA